MVMKLACSSQMAPGNTFSEKFTNLVKYGFEGMEIRLLVDDDLPALIKELKEASAATGIKPSSLLMPSPDFRRPLIDEEALNAKIEHIKKATWVAGQLGCPTLTCPEYGFQNPLPLFSTTERYSPYERELFIKLLNAADAAAKENGATVLLEPINRYETHYNHRLEHAVELIQAVGSKRIKVLADFFHMNIEEDDIPAAIRKNGAYIGHVHLGDSNRLLPGQGHTDFAAGFAALKEVGYKGFLAMECSIPAPETFEAELTECVRFLRQCIAGKH